MGHLESRVAGRAWAVYADRDEELERVVMNISRQHYDALREAVETIPDEPWVFRVHPRQAQAWLNMPDPVTAFRIEDDTLIAETAFARYRIVIGKRMRAKKMQ